MVTYLHVLKPIACVDAAEDLQASLPWIMKSKGQQEGRS
jgi:hypothetical protein